MIIYQALEITIILNSNNNVYTNFRLIAYCVLKKILYKTKHSHYHRPLPKNIETHARSTFPALVIVKTRTSNLLRFHSHFGNSFDRARAQRV